MLFALSRSDEAIESIQNAIKLRPDLVPAYAALGEIHAARGEYVDAIGAYGRASELSPEDDSLHARMSRVHLAAGQIDAANAECKYLQDRQSQLAAAPSKRDRQRLNEDQEASFSLIRFLRCVVRLTWLAPRAMRSTPRNRISSTGAKVGRRKNRTPSAIPMMP